MSDAEAAWAEWDTCEMDEEHRAAKAAFMAGYRIALEGAAEAKEPCDHIQCETGIPMFTKRQKKWLRDRALAADTPTTATAEPCTCGESVPTVTTPGPCYWAENAPGVQSQVHCPQPATAEGSDQ
jgi:hypothetical protein